MKLKPDYYLFLRAIPEDVVRTENILRNVTGSGNSTEITLSGLDISLRLRKCFLFFKI
jgi:hypothetical protein